MINKYFSNHRAYFKNDNFFLATQRENQQKEKQQEQKQKNYQNDNKIYNRKVISAKNKQDRIYQQIKRKDEQIILKNSSQTAQDLFKVNDSVIFSKYHTPQDKNISQFNELKKLFKKKTQKKQKKDKLQITNQLVKIQNQENNFNSLQLKSVSPLQNTSDKVDSELSRQIKCGSIKTQNEAGKEQIKKQLGTNSSYIFKGIFLPKSTMSQQNFPQTLTENEKGPKKQAKKKSQYQLQKQRKRQDFNLKNQIKKLMQDLQSQELKPVSEPKQKQIKVQDKKPLTQKKAPLDQDKSEVALKEEQKQLEKKSKKKIRKVNNYQRLDLKRKYKDKFVGGLKQNQRRHMKNGALKFKYRMAQSQLEIQNGEIYNTYIHSLSKSFHVDLNLGSDSQDSQLQRDIQIPHPNQCCSQTLTCLIKDMFGFQKFRQGQFEVVHNILNHQSTIFVSQTASGKSLTYILSSLIMGDHQKGMSIVISPLIALMLDQLEHLPVQLPAACISSLINYEQRGDILQLVKNNKVKLLFMTPQTLMTDILFHLKQFPPINFVCIDEAHCLSQLSHNFRTSYIALSEIIMNQINYNSPNSEPTILCLTATANTETILSLSKKLKIKSIIKSSSTLNKNLYITITREIGSQSKYRSLVQYLSTKEIMKCRGILIYCRSKYLIDKVFNYLINSNMPATVFHGALTNKEKTKIITEFKNKTIKIIISTTALGMGLDFQHLDCIIHFNMAKSLESFVQQTGRAGRRQNRAYCNLFLDQSDYFIERNYILADELQQPSLATIISQIQRSRSLAKITKLNPKQTKAKIKKDKQKQAQDQMERVIKKVSMAIQKFQDQQPEEDYIIDLFQELQSDQNPPQNNQFLNQKQNDGQGNQFSKLYYIRVKQLAEKTFLRQQALLSIFMNLSQLLNKELVQSQQKEVIKVLPLSNEVLKLSFFKSNENKLVESQKHGQFYRELIGLQGRDVKNATCKKSSGAYHINLISKCNELKLTPIELMTKVYEVTNQYVMKVEFVNEVYVFSVNQEVQSQQHVYVSFNQLLRKLKDKKFQERVIGRINDIQKTSMTKLDVFYSLAFNYSQVTMQQLIKKRLIISRQALIPKDNIMNQITKYFNTDLNSFYQYLAQTDDQLEREMFLPTEIVDGNQINTVYEFIKLFFKHQFSNLRDLSNMYEAMDKKEAILEEFKDGKVITRVFLGVNQEKSSRLIYGQHTYWRRFIKKKYISLLKTVRELIQKGKKDIINS